MIHVGHNDKSDELASYSTHIAIVDLPIFLCSKCIQGQDKDDVVTHNDNVRVGRYQFSLM